MSGNNQKITEMFARLRAKLERSLSEMPEVIGNEGVNYSLEAFEREAWEGRPWAKRKNKKDQSRAILVKTSRLKRSLRVIRKTGNSVTWGSTGVPYAQVHNDGLEITRAARSETFVRNRYKRGPKSKLFGGLGAYAKGTTAGQGLTFKSYSYRMTMRKFIGDTPALRARLKAVAKDKLLTDLGLKR